MDIVRLVSSAPRREGCVELVGRLLERYARRLGHTSEQAYWNSFLIADRPVRSYRDQWVDVPSKKSTDVRHRTHDDPSFDASTFTEATVERLVNGGSTRATRLLAYNRHRRRPDEPPALARRAKTLHDVHARARHRGDNRVDGRRLRWVSRAPVPHGSPDGGYASGPGD